MSQGKGFTRRLKGVREEKWEDVGMVVSSVLTEHGLDLQSLSSSNAIRVMGRHGYSPFATTEGEKKKHGGKKRHIILMVSDSQTKDRLLALNSEAMKKGIEIAVETNTDGFKTKFSSPSSIRARARGIPGLSL